jgi:hypothetical protein
VQGNAGQALVGDEQVRPPAQVKNRPAFGLGSPKYGRSLIRSPGGQQPLGRATDAPGGVWGQRVLAEGLG